VVVPVAMGGGAPDPTCSVLDRAQRAQDRLPADSGTGPLGAVRRDSPRLVGTVDGKHVYVAPSSDDSICVLADDGDGLTAGCPARRTIKNRPSYVAWREGNARDVTVVLLTPDQYDVARVAGEAVPVHDNVALTHAPVGGHSALELDGEQGSLEGDLNLSDDQ
jgi:hypothetical protein